MEVARQRIAMMVRTRKQFAGAEVVNFVGRTNFKPKACVHSCNATANSNCRNLMHLYFKERNQESAKF
jgi:hypothetical protein